MLVEDLRTYLINNNKITADNSFIGNFPDTENDLADNIIFIRNTGGLEVNRYLPIKDLTIQISGRNSDYDAGYAVLSEIRNLLHGLTDLVELAENGVDVMNCFAMQEVSYVGMDESDRHLFSVNFIFRLRDSE